MKEKILWVLLSIIIVAMVIISLMFFKFKSSENHEVKETVNVNNHESFLKNQTFNKLLITDVFGKYNGESYLLGYNIVNQTSEIIHLGSFTVDVRDKDGKSITSVDFNCNCDLSSGQNYPIIHYLNDNIIDAYSVVFTDIS